MQNINWYGCYVLTMREIMRFLKVYNQTLIAPAISAMIFLAVFVLAIGSHNNNINGIKFINFMGYGLIIMSIVQNAFSNSSSSLIMSKVLGYINDFLMAPFSGIEIVISLCVSSILRGMLVGVIVWLCLLPFIDFYIYHPKLFIYFVISSCLLLSLFGILSGLIARNFEQNAMFTSYVVTPLSFLSGTFYSVEKLPYFFKVINYCNPFFYMIDGFRYSITNHADSNIMVGSILLCVFNVILLIIITHLINIGWRIKE